MRYTQEQIREIVGLTIETLRHWRNVVPYLRPKTGKAARYTFSDAIALTTLREITNTGLSISGIADGIDDLFNILSKTFWQSLKGKFFVIDRRRSIIVTADRLNEQVSDRVCIITPCDVVLARLQDEMYPAIEIQSQRTLPFPPKAVKGK